MSPISTTDPKNGLQALLYHLPSSDFHDITVGFNGNQAEPGYDLVTGLGSPIANLVVTDLVGVAGIGDFMPLDQLSDQPPAIATVNGQIYVAWSGRNDELLNFMPVDSSLTPEPALS